MSVVLEKLAGLENGLFVLAATSDDCSIDDSQDGEHEVVVFLESIWIVKL
jgi:hypothetical protein